MSNRTAILMGRMEKLENFQSKNVNLMNGIVFGGELTLEQKQYFTGEKFREIAKARIEKAENLKLKIALAVYDDLFTP